MNTTETCAAHVYKAEIVKMYLPEGVAKGEVLEVYKSQGKVYLTLHDGTKRYDVTVGYDQPVTVYSLRRRRGHMKKPRLNKLANQIATQALDLLDLGYNLYLEGAPFAEELAVLCEARLKRGEKTSLTFGYSPAAGIPDWATATINLLPSHGGVQTVIDLSPTTIPGERAFAVSQFYLAVSTAARCLHEISIPGTKGR